MSEPVTDSEINRECRFGVVHVTNTVRVSPSGIVYKQALVQAERYVFTATGPPAPVMHMQAIHAGVVVFRASVHMRSRRTAVLKAAACNLIVSSNGTDETPDDIN